jgi:hypothetical protein
MKKTPVIEAVDAQGAPVDSTALEAMGTMFDPATQHIDLTKDEKRRTTALLMAIQAYEKLIIKDAEMYRAISDDMRRNDGPKIQPATVEAMVATAAHFDRFIAGHELKQEKGDTDNAKAL